MPIGYDATQGVVINSLNPPQRESISLGPQGDRLPKVSLAWAATLSLPTAIQVTVAHHPLSHTPPPPP